MRSSTLLYDFLLARFDSGELHRLISLHYPELVPRLPGRWVSAAEFTAAVTALLEREGVIDRGLFDLLRSERPRFAATIDELEAALSGKAGDVSPRPAGRGTPPSTQAASPSVDPASPASLKIVFLAANPIELPELELSLEAKKIEDKLRGTPSASRFRFTSIWRASPDDLVDMFFEAGPPPAILHFAGHGNLDGTLNLQVSDGRAHPVAPEALAELVAARPPEQRPRLVIFNACYSVTAARAMCPYVDAVVGMRSAVADEAAMRFAVQFYRALAHRDSLQTALDTARAALRVFNLPGHDMPQLTVRGDLDPRTYVLL